MKNFNSIRANLLHALFFLFLLAIGRLVQAQHGLTSTGTFTWNTEGNQTGVYFYHLIADGEIRQSGKIILNK